MLTVLDMLPPLPRRAHCSEQVSGIPLKALPNLKNLAILSLGRSQIEKLSGLEETGATLRELWISYNNIEKLAGIEKLKALEILFMCAPSSFCTWSCRLPAAADAGPLVAGRTTT